MNERVPLEVEPPAAPTSEGHVEVELQPKWKWAWLSFVVPASCCDEQTRLDLFLRKLWCENPQEGLAHLV